MWLMLMANMTRSAFVWEIDDSANVLQSRDPQLIHILVLLTLTGVLLSLAYPTLKRFYDKLEVTPLTGLIAVGTVIGSIALMVFGAQLVATQQRMPMKKVSIHPPERINTILPTADSIARGEALYAEYCLMWQGESGDFRALRNQLDDFPR